MFKKGRVNLRNILLVFMILQPFFDSYVLYSDEVINFFGFSPTTILRFLIIGLIALIIFLDKKYSNSRKPLIIYGIFIGIYIVFHHVVCSGIDNSLISSNYVYSIFEEIFYLMRLIYPILLAYIVYSMNLTKKEFKSVIVLTSLVFSLIILLLNIFELSLTSYFSNYIKGNIFDWVSSNIGRYDLASKGWFNSANQIGGLILVLVPLMFYYTITDLKRNDLIILCLLILACFAIGTRISGLGIALVLIALFICFYIFKIFKKIKICKKEVVYSLIIFFFSLITFSYAPIVNCSGNNISCILNIKNVVTDISNKGTELEQPDYDGSNVCKFLEKTSTTVLYYTELYPCNENIDFWKKYVEEEQYKYIDNRIMEKIITEDVYGRINNLKVRLFGMSRSRFLSAKIYLEKDIIVHYYTIGIFGIILFILPYFIKCLLVGLNLLFNKKISFRYICLISAVLLPLFLSVMAGHIVDELIVTMNIGFVFGYLIRQYNDMDNKLLLDKDSNKENILFVVDEKRMGGVSILLTDILNLLDYDKFNIDVLVLHNNGDSLNNVNRNIRIIYGTSFFEAIDYNLSDLIRKRNIKLILKKLNIIFLMKTCLIKKRIICERRKILDRKYDVEIAFKDGFSAVFTAYGDSEKRIHWLHYEYKKYNANGNYDRLFRNILPKFDNIVAVSRNVMNDFNEIYHLDKKTMVIENIIDTDRVLKLSKEECEKKKFNKKINIVCVGRLHQCKGYDRLIKAVTKLSDTEKQLIDIEIYGDGLEKNNLKKLIDNYSLNDIICLNGQVDNPYKYIKGSDLFILSSYFETFGLVIVESMVLGVPVLACENSNTNSLIKNKNNGYIVKNDDEELFKGLKFLINNRNEIEKYKNNLCNYTYKNDKIISKINSLLFLEKE